MKALLSFLFVFLNMFYCVAQCDWAPLGPSDYNQPSYGVADYTKMVKDTYGNIFIGFSDDDHGNKASVKKYNGATWSNVGMAGFSTAGATQNDIAIDASNTIYVAFCDIAFSNKLTVMKYTGSNWVNVGTPGFTPGQVSALSLAIDPLGTPYVAYADNANGNKASVMFFNGTNWVNTGTAGFSAGSVFGGIQLSISASFSIYVGYSDVSNGYYGTVMTFNGSAWVPLGAAAFTGAPAGSINMTLDGNGFPFVVFQSPQAYAMSYNGTSWVSVGSGISSGAYSIACAIAPGNIPYILYFDSSLGIPVVKKFNGTNWIVVGNTVTVMVSGIYYTDMMIDNNGNPLIAWRGNSNRAEVFKLNSSVWDRVGTFGFSELGSSYPFMAISSNNTPYAIYTDIAYQNKAVVKKFTGTSWVTVGNPGICASYSMASSVVHNTSMLLTSTGIPYLVMSEGNLQDKVYVKTLIGNTWQDLDSNDVSLYGADSPSIVKDSFDSLYVGFMDMSIGSKAAVKKFNGTTWVDVGVPGFSGGTAGIPNLAISPANDLYMAYADGLNGNKITVKKFNGTNWMTVGVPGFSSGTPSQLQILTDKNGIPYVTYPDAGAGNQPTIMFFNGTNWVSINTTGLTGSSVYNTSITFDSANNLYLLYGEDNNEKKAVVKKYTGTSWVTVGSPWFTSTFAYYPRLTIDTNDVLHMIFTGDGTFAYKFNFTPTITTTGAACEGSTLSLSGFGGNNYTWQGPNSFSATAQNIMINPVTYSNSGTYSLTVNSGSCVVTKTINLNINSNPTITVSSGSICEGNSFTFTPSGANSYSYSGGQIVSPTVTTSYSITGTDVNGCITATPAISNVTVNSLPVINATTNDSIICAAQITTLTANGANTYTWSNALTGNSIVISPTINTTYTVTGTDLNGCNNIAIVTQSVSLCIGIATISGEDRLIKIYPNPTNSFFNVEILKRDETTTVEVYNSIGQLIISKSVTENFTNFDLSAFANGLYIVKVRANNKTASFSRLIKN